MTLFTDLTPETSWQSALRQGDAGPSNVEAAVAGQSSASSSDVARLVVTDTAAKAYTTTADLRSDSAKTTLTGV